MDNNFHVYEQDYYNEGPTDYLGYILSTTRKLPTGKTEQPIERYYFSVQAALSDLLLMPMASIVGTEMGRLEQAVVYDRHTKAPIASMELNVPGPDYKQDLPMGVYLTCWAGINTLRQQSGLPLPTFQASNQSNRVLLAMFADVDNHSLDPTQWYNDLRAYADHDHRVRDIESALFAYQLRLKGYQTIKDPNAQLDGTAFQVVQQHYFQRRHEGIRHLLNTNFYHFDLLGSHNGTNQRYTHAYLMDAEEYIYARLMTQPIEPADSPDLRAGIYLSTEPDIRTLETETGLNFRAFEHYNPTSRYLKLVSYVYENGYQLSAPDMVPGESARLILPKGFQDPVNTASFVLAVTYQRNNDDSAIQSFGRTQDFFYFDSPQGAVAKMLELPLQQFREADQPSAPGFYIHSAEVTHKEIGLIAAIEKQGTKEDPFGTELALIFYQRQTLPVFLFAIVQSMAEATVHSNSLESSCKVPFARLSDTNMMVALPSHGQLLELLEPELPFGKKFQRDVAQHLQKQSSSPSTPYLLTQVWVHTEGDQQLTSSEKQMVVFGLEAAFKALCLESPYSFRSITATCDNAMLSEIFLRQHGHSDIIARRYYVPKGESRQAEGVYLALELGHPDGRALALKQIRTPELPLKPGNMQLLFADWSAVSSPHRSRQIRPDFDSKSLRL